MALSLQVPVAQAEGELPASEAGRALQEHGLPGAVTEWLLAEALQLPDPGLLPAALATGAKLDVERLARHVRQVRHAFHRLRPLLHACGQS